MRSPELMNADDTALLVVDVQAKLMPMIPNRRKLVANIVRMIKSAQVLGVPVFATEQYPKGLGATVSPIVELLTERPEKLTFSCCGAAEMLEALRSSHAKKVLLCGIEAHVCIQQTAFDLDALGRKVYLAADAVGSRGEYDKEIALARMREHGLVITTTEAAIFEWTRQAGTPEFKSISKLITSSEDELVGESTV